MNSSTRFSRARLGWGRVARCETFTSRRPSLPTARRQQAKQGRVRLIVGLSSRLTHPSPSRRATSGRRFSHQPVVGEVGMNRHSNRHTPPKGSASCVQSFDDSQFSAIRITYRISLRSSSLWEPRHPLLKVLNVTSLSSPDHIEIRIRRL